MIVNSHNEWDQLEEVIVGAGIPSELPAIEFSFKLFFHDNIYDKPFDGDINAYITKQHIDEHNEDIENFALLLHELGVNVRRPKIPDKIYKIKTPYWDSVVHPALNVRDQCMIIGDTIIETPPTCRWRYFENDYMKHIFNEYMQQGARWIQCPKPIMLDSSFDLSYVVEKNPESKTYYEQSRKHDDHYMNHGCEMMFDAANAMRLGTHILLNVANENQRLGAQWLQNILGNEYKVLSAEICDSHIDSSFLPLRPGLAIITRPEVKDVLPKELQNWDLVYVPDRDRDPDDYKSQNVKLASTKIELNVFSVSPEVIICHPEFQKILSDKLKKYNIEAIPSKMRHCEIFSGAHHCTTLDVRRKSKLENYID